MNDQFGDEFGVENSTVTKASSFHVGNTVFGKFKLTRVLGEGATGKVYAAQVINSPEPHQIVALKVLSKKASRDKGIVERFRNEIHASYRISHSSVVRGTEFFRGDDCLAFTMEYVTGGSLERKINRTPMDLRECVNALDQILIGVNAVHESGLIHQDLKPANILCSDDGKIKITDFTTAKIAAHVKPSPDGGITGTWEYISPEGLSEGLSSFRSDIYAVGIIGYEMITGDVPFRGKNSYHEAELKLFTTPIPPHMVRPECPFALSKFIMCALERNSENRFRTAEQMRFVLENLDYHARPGIFDAIFYRFKKLIERLNRRVTPPPSEAETAQMKRP